MSTLDLRPLSIGEILDRTFSLYRRNFLLFVGIAAIPQLLVLALQLAQIAFMTTRSPIRPRMATDFQTSFPGVSAGSVLGFLGFIVAFVIIYTIAYSFSQGATVFAVSELYLGRTTTIGQSLGRVRGELLYLVVLIIFYILVIGFSFLFFIIPAIYMACRLCVCIPSALLENLGPVDALQRSFKLTEDNAGRAFLILFLYVVILYAAIFLFEMPFLIALGVQAAAHDASMVRMFTALTQFGNFAAAVLVTPVMTIASSIFYFDLRVRKEAFDLQMMMNPLDVGVPAPRTATTLLS
jgi:hypothetical protein